MTEIIDFPAPKASAEDPEAPGRPAIWFSLGAIVGNEEHHIERFFQAFEPLVDEIVLVRSIGCLEPDQTFEIAKRIATKPLILSEYRNSEDTAAWPHVDDFGAARQKAFDLTTGEFIMWADCDDIIDPDSLKRLRGQVDLGNFDMLMISYRCRGHHPLMRERVIRRGAGRWCHPVHEAISVKPNVTTLARLDIEFFHDPIGLGLDGKPKDKHSLDRNLRILQHAIEPAAITYFYLHRDAMLANDMKAAIEWGKMAVLTTNLTPAERYRVYFNCAQIFLLRAAWGEMETFAMNGIRMQPERRECYCIMALSYLEKKDYGKALTWIQLAQCIAVPDPRNRPNWYEEAWYSWRSNLTEAMILRKLGLMDEAKAAEDREHGGFPMISLLHATRGRPEKAVLARDQWVSNSLKPGMIEHIFAIDADDKKSLEELDGFKTVVVGPGGGCVAAWNAAAAIARGRVLIQMSDDWNPAFHWDNLIAWRLKDAIEQKKPAVLAISDGFRKDRLLCMAILTREYYLSQKHETTGEPYLFHPDYKGVYSDNEFTIRAYENGVVVEARDIVFVHTHPLFTGGEADETYLVQNSPERYAEGLQVFNRRNPTHRIEPPADPGPPARPSGALVELLGAATAGSSSAASRSPANLSSPGAFKKGDYPLTTRKP